MGCSCGKNKEKSVFVCKSCGKEEVKETCMGEEVKSCCGQPMEKRS